MLVAGVLKLGEGVASREKNRAMQEVSWGRRKRKQGKKE